MPPPLDDVGGVDLAADTLRTLRETLADIRAESPDVEISEHVVEGPGGPALLSQAADASLLVVGARAGPRSRACCPAR